MSRRALATAAEAAWRAAAAKEAARSGRSLESLTSTTAEGLRIEPVYLGAGDEAPGVFPFTRGAYATMYSAKPWTIRQYAGFSSAEESNAFYRRNVAAGTGARVSEGRRDEGAAPAAADDVGTRGPTHRRAWQRAWRSRRTPARPAPPPARRERVWYWTRTWTRAWTRTRRRCPARHPS